MLKGDEACFLHLGRTDGAIVRVEDSALGKDEQTHQCCR